MDSFRKRLTSHIGLPFAGLKKSGRKRRRKRRQLRPLPADVFTMYKNAWTVGKGRNKDEHLDIIQINDDDDDVDVDELEMDNVSVAEDLLERKEKCKKLLTRKLCRSIIPNSVEVDDISVDSNSEINEVKLKEEEYDDVEVEENDAEEENEDEVADSTDEYDEGRKSEHNSSVQFYGDQEEEDEESEQNNVIANIDLDEEEFQKWPDVEMVGEMVEHDYEKNF